MIIWRTSGSGSTYGTRYSCKYTILSTQYGYYVRVLRASLARRLHVVSGSVRGVFVTGFTSSHSSFCASLQNSNYNYNYNKARSEARHRHQIASRHHLCTCQCAINANRYRYAYLLRMHISIRPNSFMARRRASAAVQAVHMSMDRTPTLSRKSSVGRAALFNQGGTGYLLPTSHR